MAISSKKLSLIISIIVLAVMIITFSCYILFNNTTEDLYGGHTGFSDYIEGTLWAYATLESGQILSDTFFILTQFLSVPICCLRRLCGFLASVVCGKVEMQKTANKMLENGN